MDAFYHYTSAQNWGYMQTGEAYPAYENGMGLRPCTRLVGMILAARAGLPEHATQGRISGLLESTPQSWLQKEFEDRAGTSCLETIVKKICRDDIILLRVKILPDDDVYIADHATLLGPLSRKTLHAYYNSLTPAHAYRGDHLMPEVVCFSSIPLSRLQCIESAKIWDLMNQWRKGTDKPALLPPAEPQGGPFDSAKPASTGLAAQILPFTRKPRGNTVAP